MVSGNRRKFTQRDKVGGPLSAGSARLLRNVNLFLFVYVSEEVYQTTNKGNCCQPECDPSLGMTAGGVRIGHKSVKVEDRSEGGCNADQYRENIFQAFHFEPPAR